MELRHLLAVAEGEWRGLILVALYMGLRLGDVAALEYGYIDKKARCMRVAAFENQTRMQPIPPPLMRHIESLPPGRNAKAAVFPRAFALVRSGKISLLCAEFVKLLESAGLRHPKDRSKTRGGGDDNFLPLSFSSLRYSYVWMLIRAGIPERVAADLCGLRSITISEHSENLDLHAAVERLPAI